MKYAGEVAPNPLAYTNDGSVKLTSKAHTKLLPLGKCSVRLQLKTFSIDYVTFLVEMVLN